MTTLKAEKRDPQVKAKKLRREGYVTGILSGKEMKEPVALQFDVAEAAKFIKANKEGTQIYLDIEGEKVDALVKNIDYNPIEKQLMALDFQALVAGEKVSTTVAVKLEHTELVQGIVEQEMEEIHYKADPANLLDTIVIDFNGYPADVRDIHVKDLPIPEGNAMGEGHHIYKINGMYYILSADYSPMGRMQCARSKSIWGPYETCVISERESYGYAAGWSVGNMGIGRPLPEDGFKFQNNKPNGLNLGCATIHQGGIVQAPDGKWWGVSMQDFNAVGRTVCLSPITWVDGWPYFGLEKNLGRSPRTWFKPNDMVKTPQAPYDRCDDFSGKTFKPVWQWNHNPNDKMWSLNKERKGWLRLHSMPAKQLLWAKNTLTQRAIGPVSYTSVKLDASRLKVGDEAGLGAINTPYALLGVVKTDKGLVLRCYDQNTNKEVVKPLDKKVVWLRLWGDYDKSQLQYSYSLDGMNWENIGEQMLSPYQLKTFQGVRVALYAFNKKELNGGVADFDDFKVEEPMADRTANLPIGKTIRFSNLADGSLMDATGHGLMHSSSNRNDMRNQVKFVVEDRGKGKIALKTADGRYVYIAGAGLSGDVRLTSDSSKAEEFVWQDMLYNRCMLLSLKTQRYVGKNPIDGSPYSADFQGTDAGMKNGCVFGWEVVE